jgi:hypothetical protein
MPSRIITVRPLGIALVTLLLCAIFAAELPELLSLTDNAANDFALRAADSLVSPVLGSVRDVQKAAIKFNNSAQDSLLGLPGSHEKMELGSCLFILYYPQRV